MNRRSFAKKTLAASALISAMPFEGFSMMPSGRNIRKGIMWGTIGVGETIAEKFLAVKQAGFDGIEAVSHLNRDEVIDAKALTGLDIPSVYGALHGKFPLSDPDPAIREKGVEALMHTIQDAALYGADTVLLVPGRVNAEVSYDEVWDRSVYEIRKVIPLAEKLNVKIAIENVWNNFLLSPLEAVRYVDLFGSAFVRFYFDCGNILLYGWPEQWIRILGKRIVKVHIKEYSRKIADTNGRSAGFRVDLLEGDVNWNAVMKALDDNGYNDWAITEQPGGNTPEGLADLSARLTRILESQDKGD
jgi:L-ribulose-5-phosphate 3-epimerase